MKLGKFGIAGINQGLKQLMNRPDFNQGKMQGSELARIKIRAWHEISEWLMKLGKSGIAGINQGLKQLMNRPDFNYGKLISN